MGKLPKKRRGIGTIVLLGGSRRCGERGFDIFTTA